MYKVVSRWPHQNTIKIEWNLGKRCNLDCAYCPSYIHDNHSPHTDINLLKSAVDKLTETNKPIRLSFTGGEPSVHPNIEELLHYCKLRGISWISMTTNATRTVKWYLDTAQYLDQYVFSLHFEKDWERLRDTIANIGTRKPVKCLVHVMAHHKYMKEVREAVHIFKTLDIPYAVRRIRWTEGDHDLFDDMRYDPNDLEWIKKSNATVEPNCIIDDEKYMHANDIIKLHYNQFKGWNCNAGLESLMVNWDGEVHRATCRVGGSLGNIYKGTFQIPQDPVVCTRNWCTCEADIPLTKVNEQVQEISEQN